MTKGVFERKRYLKKCSCGKFFYGTSTKVYCKKCLKLRQNDYGRRYIKRYWHEVYKPRLHEREIQIKGMNAEELLYEVGYLKKH